MLNNMFLEYKFWSKIKKIGLFFSKIVSTSSSNFELFMSISEGVS
jgi:hypothetical protein